MVVLFVFFLWVGGGCGGVGGAASRPDRMGCCGSKQDATGAYGEGAAPRAAVAAPPRQSAPQVRKGSVAMFSENVRHARAVGIAIVPAWFRGI
eukprot:COSAG02_NODE_741_length_17813_cov_51.487863_5_plen_93_part_00